MTPYTARMRTMLIFAALTALQLAPGTATAQSRHPRSPEAMRQVAYTGSPLVIERTLAAGAGHTRYVASYQSDGYTIYGLLTIPTGAKPKSGWPAIVLNHGYVAPAIYRTTERYTAHQNALARRGYVTFKPDYRGHGDSEGAPSAGYGSGEYTVDVINAVRSVQRHPDVDKTRIGLWGHSMGGGLGLRAMRVIDDVKAAVFWAGVVGPYDDVVNRWVAPERLSRSPAANAWHIGLRNEFGAAADDAAFWRAVSPTSDLSGMAPIQLHHGTRDDQVPAAFSETLAGLLKNAGREQELYLYRGDNHNLTASYGIVMQRTLAWFDKYLKD
jgi:uncharacterized protein